MGWKDWFKKEEVPLDPLTDLVLARLRVGYLVDYDMRTWQVAAHNRYEYGDGHAAEEWELVSEDDRVYLGLERDDGESWGLHRKLPLGAIDGDVRQHIKQHDDAPERVTCKGTAYRLDESGGGYMTPEGGADRQGFLYWGYLDENEEHYLTIEQWGEAEFEASLGEQVEEYQFSNILPGSG